MLMFPIALVAVVYLNPWSLHQVVTANYEQFGMPPDSQGIVHFESGVSMDFRNANSELSAETVEEIRRKVKADCARNLCNEEVVANLAAVVCSGLSKVDSSRPLADTVETETLYQNGRQYFALCSDYARLMNAVLQAAEIPARIIWMEGHVVVEYFNTEIDQWVFVDPHFGLIANSADGNPLSIAQLVYAVERNLPFQWKPIAHADTTRVAEPMPVVDTVWYRNVLLNGECHCLSADTLNARGRWTQLLFYRSRPKVLALRTPFDTSEHAFAYAVRPREVAFLMVVLVTTSHLGRWLLSANRAPFESMPIPNRTSILPGVRAL